MVMRFTYFTDNINIQKCAFGYNTAIDEAAAVYISPRFNNVKIYDCDFYKNKGKNVISLLYLRHCYATLDIKRCNFYFNDASHTIYSGFTTYITNCAFFKNTGENVLDDDFMVYFTWCWFGNTKSNPAANMVKFGHLYPAPIKDPENWYVLGDDFTTSDTMIYDKSKVSVKRIAHVKNCDLRLNRDLLVKLINES